MTISDRYWLVFVNMIIKLVHNNEEIFVPITTIWIYLLNGLATVGGLHQELNYGTTSSSSAR